MTAEPKLDGLAVSLLYRNGTLVQAATRGDGEVGEDVTQNARAVTTIPKQLTSSAPPETLEVRGEIFMPLSAFRANNERGAATGGRIFANPRNAAAGTMRQHNSEVVAERGLAFIAYGFGEVDSGWLTDSQFDNLQQLRSLGFELNGDTRLLTGLDEITAYYNWLLARRDTLPIEIDGIVYKLDSLAEQQELGFASKAPRWATARKFPPQQRETKILEVVFPSWGEPAPSRRLRY